MIKDENRRGDLLLSRFGRYLNWRREQENLTLRDFAHRAKVSHSYILQLEQCKIDPKLTSLQKLARGFNESLGVFLKPVLKEEKREQ